ncbi:TlpA disulfide reductase family protein [Bacteriovorax sp. Seq25_V]|uniref:TlpA family protein disulfide reductase n=1 Tax=Bacteriovorax sp. Seq25_V TaxID=1201288 RepID=UPI000389EC09|nr:TlpA disulfide reductase family protein [Bacteriovorax sp. Seq25_V]EQC43415.1 redoxin [Bacteriovorax sp. Seq25_V]
MQTTKKFFPLNIVVVLSVILLGVFVIPQYDSLFAKKSENISKQFKHYESMLSTLEFKKDDGTKIENSELQKGFVIVNFWASWCQPCLEEFPSLVSLRTKYDNSKLKIIAINSDEPGDIASVKKTKDKYKLNFDIVLDSKGTLTDKYMVSSIPVSIIYHNGKVIEVSKGSKDFLAEEFLEKLNSL